MAFFRACKRLLRSKGKPSGAARAARDESGIALFIVMAAMAVLALLVTEFTYVSQVNQRIAYEGADQLKAHYLAKSAYKLSLLRLKAYTQIKGMLEKNKATGQVPQRLVDQVWAFPLMFPIPELGNISGIQKERLRKFREESELDGNFTALIESESAKYNLNRILAPYVAEPPQAATGATGPTGRSNQPPRDPNDSESRDDPNQQEKTAEFDPKAARESLRAYLKQLFMNKVENDRDFADEYREVLVDDLLENIVTWADRSYEGQLWNHDVILPKQAPFYSISELRMIPPMDDTLYDLFAPALTVSRTPGININTMSDPTLKALVPGITDEEVRLFFEFRDSTEQDNSFKDEEAFFNWIGKHVQFYVTDSGELGRLKEDLKKRNIQFVTQESVFKITVRANKNNATKTLEAWVELEDTANPSGGGARQGSAPNGEGYSNAVTGAGGAAQCSRDTGLKVTFMRAF